MSETMKVTHKIRQVNVTIGVKEHVVGFYIAMNNVVAVNITQSAAKLGYPEANCIFSKCFSRNMKA